MIDVKTLGGTPNVQLTGIEFDVGYRSTTQLYVHFVTGLAASGKLTMACLPRFSHSRSHCWLSVPQKELATLLVISAQVGTNGLPPRCANCSKPLSPFSIKTSYEASLPLISHVQGTPTGARDLTLISAASTSFGRYNFGLDEVWRC